MATTESQSLLTAEQFLLPPNTGPTELVRGRVIEMTPPGFRHGEVCYVVARLVGDYVAEHELGRVVMNDSGVVTDRDPDSVRGADVAYYSFARLPKDQSPRGYPAIPPDVVFEVRSPTDRRGQVDEKTAEYVAAGVKVVCALDPDPETVHVHRAGETPQVLGLSDDLVLPEIDASFRVLVSRSYD